MFSTSDGHQEIWFSYFTHETSGEVEAECVLHQMVLLQFYPSSAEKSVGKNGDQSIIPLLNGSVDFWPVTSQSGEAKEGNEALSAAVIIRRRRGNRTNGTDVLNLWEQQEREYLLSCLRE